MSCRNVGRAADQHEAAVAVTAIDIAFFVDFHVDARMTERRSTGNIGCAVAGDAGSCNANGFGWLDHSARSEEHTSELQSLMRISYAVFCLKKKQSNTQETR